MTQFRDGKQLVEHYRQMAISEGTSGAEVVVILHRVEYDRLYNELTMAIHAPVDSYFQREAIVIYGVLTIRPK